MVQVPAATVETADTSLGDFLGEALDESSTSDLLTGELPAANGPALRRKAPPRQRPERRRVKVELASGSGLRLTVLVLIAVDAVQSGIWDLPSIFSGLGLGHLVSSFSGWLTLAGLAAHVGLIVGGIGILSGQEFGKKCVAISAFILLGLAALGFLMILPNLGAMIGFFGIGRIIGLVLRSIALPLAIAICVCHPAWER